MTEIIYLDIDGTLRDDRNGISRRVKKALNACRKKGIRIVICTGRNPGSIPEEVKALAVDGVISGGGCFIQLAGSQWRTGQFSETCVKEFLEEIREQEYGAALEAEKKIYMNRRAAEFYRRDFEGKLLGLSEKEKERRRRDNGILYRDNLAELSRKEERIHKICLLGSGERLERTRRKFSADSRKVQSQSWNGTGYLELLPAGCGKGTAVELVNRRLGVSAENSLGFGDGDNDLDMLKAMGIAVAVETGSPKLKRYADSICEGPKEDGICREFLRRGILSPGDLGEA